MFMKRPTYRKFDYEPRYYKPDQDPSERRRRRLGFRSNVKRRVNSKIPWLFIIMLAVILFMFLKFNGYI